MKTDMLMPQMGESITEATISRWVKKVGEAVEKDEIILEISTDKVDSEIPAPESGVLVEVLFNEGDVVPVKQKIAVISDEGSAAATPKPTKSPTETETKSFQNQPSSPSSPSKADKETSQPSSNSVNQSAANQPDSSAELVLSPLVKNLALSNNIPLSELSQISGSGSQGRITKQDFLDYLQRRQNPAQPAPMSSTPNNNQVSQTKSASNSGNNVAPAGVSEDWTPEGTKIIPMDRMRQAIAEHMVRSKATSPHVYSVQEIDVSRIAKYRAAHKNSFLKEEGFNLSFTPFFLEAAVRAIQKFPGINASVDGKSVILKKHVNLGCAVALGTSGLIVPVIKKAEELGVRGIARSLNDLATRARDKKLLPDDVAGGTFTVTNPGVFGTVIGTPIINQPQVAILCLGAIKKRPVVVDDMIAIREMCYLTLSYDHRVIDGSLSGSFLQFLSSYLENWDLKQPLR